MQPNVNSAVAYIKQHGLALAYPVKGKDDLPSLWNCFYPNRKMRWEWSDDGDDRVALIWHLRAKLSTNRKVVYSKWFNGRATFISPPLCAALLSFISKQTNPAEGLNSDALTVLRVLEDDSPLPTKVLRMETSLEGKENESRFNKALRQLWSKFLIVGYGEVEEGGFPSLAIGSTKLIFEELWDKSIELSDKERDKTIEKYISDDSPFKKQFFKFIKTTTSK